MTAAAAALGLAWAADALLGEPRNAWHPVAWLGRVLAPAGRMLLRCPPVLAAAGGALVWFALALPLVAAAAGLQGHLMGPASADVGALTWAVVLLALLLKPCFAWRMLRDEVRGVGQALEIGLEAGRERLSRLVSRDVRTLEAADVREAAIETLAENLNDSVVAPLFWWCVAGLPGAVLYRFANTADAMWGYRGRWEWAGKFAARADDVLSWLPARITALLLWPAGQWRALRREAARTPSPNGGWPMAAMALKLGAALRKPGVYALNQRAPAPDARAMTRALAHATRAAWMACALALAASAVAPGGALLQWLN